MKNLFTTIALLFMVILMFSCNKKNEPTPTAKKLSYQFKVINASATLGTSTTTAATVLWQSGYADVTSISFEGKNESNKDTHNEFKEPVVYKVDLFNTSQLLGNIDIPAGIYHNANVRLELKQSATGPALFLKGTYTTSTGSKPVELSLNEGNDQFEIIASAKDLRTTSKASYIAFISLHLDKLLAGVTPASLNAATLSNGTIAINKTSNIDIYNKIKSNISLFADVDYDSK